MMKLKEALTNPVFLVLVAAVLLPLTVPLVFVFCPVIFGSLLYWLAYYNANQPIEVTASPIPNPSATLDEQPVSIAAKTSSQPVRSPSVAAKPAATPPSPTPEPSVEPVPTPSPQPTEPSTAPAAKPANGKPAVGGAAILAKLRAQKAARAAAEAEAKEAFAKSKGLTVLYASQLGTAAEIAKNIHAEAESRGIKSHVASMNEFGFDNVSAEKTPVVVIVASSTGDGDAPDNSAKFYAALRRKTNPTDRLHGIVFTCLGLGDSNYTRFMAVPRSLRNRFAELGATTFYDTAEVDEVDGLEEGVDKWIQGLWPAVAAATASEESSSVVTQTNANEGGGIQGVPPLPKTRVQLKWLQGSEADAVRAAEAAGPSEKALGFRDSGNQGMYSPEQPFWATISDAKLLTTAAAEDRKVIHLEMDITGAGMEYHPGDSIGVMPENSLDLVDKVVSRLKLDPVAVFSVTPSEASSDTNSSAPEEEILLSHLKWPCTVRTALLRGCDLTTAPRKSLLRVLAEHCSDANDKNKLLLLCSRQGRDAYAADILKARPTLLDLLSSFPSCMPPLDALLDALPPLPPRMYSLTCSPVEVPDKVQVAFTVVRYSTATGEREGVATSWLERLCEPLLASDGTNSGNNSAKNPIRVPIFLRRGGDFRPPTDLSTPWIMVGPGTGVAPFRGFLQERKARLTNESGAVGECWLYFGCRRADQDYLYESELKAFEADGTLPRLEVAFSRAQEQKVYVQHLMEREAAQLYDLIVNKKGSVFVCGDGAAMAKDVHGTLVKILAENGGLSEADAAAQLATLAKDGRYVRDIWS